MDALLNDLGGWGYLHPEAWVIANVLLFGIGFPLTIVYFANWWTARPKNSTQEVQPQ
jgi:hypothetical protein